MSKKILGFNQEKFGNVLLYILRKCGALPHFGKTILYKLLYFSDFDFYELYEKPLTGEVYRKIQMGPAPCHFTEIVEKMIKEKKIKRIFTEYYGHRQEKYVPLIEPDLEKLSAGEIKAIDNVIDRLSSLDATQISSLSHADIPCETTGNGKIINYELVFYRKPELSVRSYAEE